MPGFLDDCDGCVCGHIKDEHKNGFFSPCKVKGCDCGDFEWDGVEDDAD